jgi:hypothetical protein
MKTTEKDKNKIPVMLGTVAVAMLGGLALIFLVLVP